MWVLLIGLSLLFLLLVFLFSLHRRIRNEAKGHVAPSELSGPSHDLKSLCHSFVEVKSVGDCRSGMESENWCELECSDSNLSFPALEYFDEMLPKKE
ncbi:hypothetical protein, conserved in T. vivax [Trypanosoma vivax Y486]|uniref:Uncharacterized protein n=1 Tax=Trypanosoma vivax (strain Y486) TaxID=1055687 RepID=F9WST8_TRYVY|nr:hypothetical protein, conserved in T. vivax [Trypanosoma vivax Y486]|eukprot:CCD20627.1 hypothetical protein, conserved in T. vivax [Trypanosoma vivax Y486]